MEFIKMIILGLVQYMTEKKIHLLMDIIPKKELKILLKKEKDTQKKF